MPLRASAAPPNLALYSLRDARGESQQDVADALNALAAPRGRRGGVCVTANQVSRWERGVTRPSPFHQQLLGEHFAVSVERLGLPRPGVAGDHHVQDEPGSAFDVVIPPRTVPAEVRASQDEWRAVRRALNARRAPLAQAVTALYPAGTTVAPGLLAHPDWLPPVPVALADVELELDRCSPDPVVVGADGASAHVRPLAAAGGRRFHRYSRAIRTIDVPHLFENRLAWKLLDLSWAGGRGFMSFGETMYFDQIDICEALAHETARSLLTAGGELRRPSWRSLPFRRHVGDPFHLNRRPLGTSTDTLTVRADRDGATFVLHNRNPDSVAVAGGMLHVMPCGIFQPSSVLPAAQAADFSLWRNIMREYSEEFLGNPDHDDAGMPIDYRADPFGRLERGVRDGTVRAFCLGVGLDALTLFGQVLTVVVLQARVYDDLFGAMVDHNAEGSVVKTGRVHPTSALPFTEHTVRELLDGGRLAPAAAGCLRLAWDHRRTILEGLCGYS